MKRQWPGKSPKWEETSRRLPFRRAGFVSFLTGWRSVPSDTSNWLRIKEVINISFRWKCPIFSLLSLKDEFSWIRSNQKWQLTEMFYIWYVRCINLPYIFMYRKLQWLKHVVVSVSTLKSNISDILTFFLFSVNTGKVWHVCLYCKRGTGACRCFFLSFLLTNT